MWHSWQPYIILWSVDKKLSLSKAELILVQHIWSSPLEFHRRCTHKLVTRAMCGCVNFVSNVLYLQLMNTETNEGCKVTKNRFRKYVCCRQECTSNFRLSYNFATWCQNPEDYDLRELVDHWYSDSVSHKIWDFYGDEDSGRGLLDSDNV